MSTVPTPIEIQKILADLNGPSKKRLAAIQKLSRFETSDPRIVVALEHIARGDPYAELQKAALEALDLPQSQRRHHRHLKTCGATVAGQGESIMRIRSFLITLLICTLVAACGSSQAGLHSMPKQINKQGTESLSMPQSAEVHWILAAIKADGLPIAILLLVVTGVAVVLFKRKPNDEQAVDVRTNDELESIIQHYSQVIQQDPGYAIAFFNRGLAYYSKGELEPAISDWDAAIQLIPADYEAYFYRGLAYVDKGEKEKAIADFKRALELCGDSSEILCLNARSALEKLGVK